MAIRIRREAMYMPLPMGAKCISALKGKSDYSMPISDVKLSQADLMVLRQQKKGCIKGLVIQLPDPENVVGNIEVASWNDCACYSVDCRLGKESAENCLLLSKIEEVSFRLRWKNGKFYPVGEKVEGIVK